MDPLTAGIVAGGISTAGSILSNQMSQDTANRQMAFQSQMSSTAHQREVEDLRKAGLNPILSALGSGSSTPSGAQGTINDLGPGLSKGVETAMAVKNLNADLALKDADTDLKHDQGSVASSQMAVNKATANQITQESIGKDLQNKLLKETLPSLIKEAKAKGDFSQIHQIMGILNSGASSARDVVETLNPLKLKTGK